MKTRYRSRLTGEFFKTEEEVIESLKNDSTNEIILDLECEKIIEADPTTAKLASIETKMCFNLPPPTYIIINDIVISIIPLLIFGCSIINPANSIIQMNTYKNPCL